MRLVAMGLLPLVLMSCGAKYKPSGPVIGDYERSFRFPVHRPHDGLQYTGRAAATDAPVLPVMAFGAAFDLDFVVMPREGDFDMIEYARMATPNGPLWLAMESRETSGDQTLLANLDELAAFMPEIPLARQTVNLQVDDKSTEFTVDVNLSYTSSNGQKVVTTLLGDPPTREARKRNGKTFHHSQNQLMAVLDIPASQSLFKAKVEAEGKDVGFKKIGGLVPGQFVLNQVQGGFAAGAYHVVPTDPAVGGLGWGEVLVHPPQSNEPISVAPPADVQARMGVAKNFVSVENCWDLRLGEQADLVGGTSRFAWTVTAGKVSDAKLANPEPTPAVEGQPAPTAPFADEALAACVVEQVNGWAFAETVSGTAWWDFTFRGAVPAAEGELAADPTVEIGEGGFTVAEAPAPAEEAPATEAAPGDAATRVDPAAAPTEELPDGEDLLGEAAPAAPAVVEARLSSFTTVHTMVDGSKVEQRWLVSRQGDRVIARQTSDLRSLTYSYRLVAEAYLELVSITVEQYGRATPVTAITFNPPIPDVRWPFNGRRTSDFVIDVNGQESYAIGTAEAFWTESGPQVKVTASAPEWAAERPMRTRISYPGDGTAEVVVERVGE